MLTDNFFFIFYIKKPIYPLVEFFSLGRYLFSIFIATFLLSILPMFISYCLALSVLKRRKLKKKFSPKNFSKCCSYWHLLKVLIQLSFLRENILFLGRYLHVPTCNYRPCIYKMYIPCYLHKNCIHIIGMQYATLKTDYGF